MFEWPFDRFRPKRLVDPVFGKLLFMKANDTALSYWGGRGLFEPLGVSIEYSVSGDETGPGEGQRQVYRRFRENYAALFQHVAPILKRAHEAQARRTYSTDIAKLFQLYSLSIPRIESETMEWEL